MHLILKWICLTHHSSLSSFISLKGVYHRHRRYIFVSIIWSQCVQCSIGPMKARTFSKYWCIFLVNFYGYFNHSLVLEILNFFLKEIEAILIPIWWAIRSAIWIIWKVRVWNVCGVWAKMKVFILQNR